MMLFGQALDGQQIFAVISMLAVLALWIVTLKREREYGRWFKDWEARRRARKEAEDARDRSSSGDSPAPPSGPWG